MHRNIPFPKISPRPSTTSAPNLRVQPQWQITQAISLPLRLIHSYHPLAFSSGYHIFFHNMPRLNQTQDLSPQAPVYTPQISPSATNPSAPICTHARRFIIPSSDNRRFFRSRSYRSSAPAHLLNPARSTSTLVGDRSLRFDSFTRELKDGDAIADWLIHRLVRDGSFCCQRIRIKAGVQI